MSKRRDSITLSSGDRGGVHKYAQVIKELLNARLLYGRLSEHIIQRAGCELNVHPRTVQRMMQGYKEYLRLYRTEDLANYFVKKRRGWPGK